MKDIKKEEILEDLDKIGDKVVAIRKNLEDLLDKIHKLEKYIGGDQDG